MARDSEIDLQALTYLVTVMMHRMQETDIAWWVEFLEELKDDRAASSAGSVREKVLGRAVSLVEQSMKGRDGE